MVEERVVSILLECYLVLELKFSLKTIKVINKTYLSTVNNSCWCQYEPFHYYNFKKVFCVNRPLDFILTWYRKRTTFGLFGSLMTFPVRKSYKISQITFVSGFVLESFTRENIMKGAVSPSHMKETTNNMTVILC